MLTLLAITFIALKLDHHIDWPWMIVFIPLALNAAVMSLAAYIKAQTKP
jgi:hypothetical protein